MKVILLKDIPKVGRKYDVKDVAEGYALNMLIPRGVAKIATPGEVKKIELLKSQDMMDKKIQNELLVKNLEIIKSLVVVIQGKANDKGHLFAGITKETIADEIFKTSRLKLDPESIKLDKPLKTVGEHTLKLEVLDKKVEFKVIVEAV